MSWIFAGRVLIIMPTHSSFEEQIRAYNEELRRYYAQSHPAAVPSSEPDRAEEPPMPAAEEEAVEVEAPLEETPAVPEATEPAPVERPWESAQVDEWMETLLHPEAIPDEEPVDPWASVTAFMEREGLADYAAEPDPSEPAQTDENTDTGYLQVRVFSARGAVPLVGAMVSVIGHDPAGQETLLYLNRTDMSGLAPQVSLPTPDRALSLKPGDATPFVSYVVQVSAPGYATIRNEGVSVYGGVTSLQGVQMIPLPEPQSEYENVVVVRPGGAPPELN